MTSTWEAKRAAYQDFVKMYPNYRDTWPAFYAGACYGEQQIGDGGNVAPVLRGCAVPNEQV